LLGSIGVLPVRQTAKARWAFERACVIEQVGFRGAFSLLRFFGQAKK